MNCKPNDTSIPPRLRSSSIERPVINYSESKSRSQPNKNTNQINNNKRKAGSSPTTVTPEAKKTTANKMAITLDELNQLFEKQTQKSSSICNKQSKTK